MARALPPASFVREAPNNLSAVPVTATGHCPVFVRPRRAKTSFPGREAAPLRFAPPSAGSRKAAGPVSAQPTPVPGPPPWLMRMCVPAEGDAMGSASRLGQSPPLEELAPVPPLAGTQTGTTKIASTQLSTRERLFVGVLCAGCSCCSARRARAGPTSKFVLPLTGYTYFGSISEKHAPIATPEWPTGLHAGTLEAYPDQTDAHRNAITSSASGDSSRPARHAEECTTGSGGVRLCHQGQHQLLGWHGRSRSSICDARSSVQRLHF